LANTLTPFATNPVQYVWNDGSTGNTLVIKSPGTYWVEAKDKAGCKVRDTSIVSSNPVNTFALPADTTICAGSKFLLTLPHAAGTQLTWMDGVSGNTRWMTPGAYSIVANNAGCTRNSSILVKAKPLPVINIGRDSMLCAGYGLTLKASYPGAQFRWSTGATDSAISVTKAGTYWAEAQINGCSFRDSMELRLRDCNCVIDLPNAFSPNGDGINDVYVPSISCYPKDFHFSVFNRYGQLVFETRDSRVRWDGKFNNQLLTVGTYYYVLTFVNETLQQPESRKGSITLLR